jgi:tetratricopeptide (TPR) repeat protein
MPYHFAPRLPGRLAILLLAAGLSACAGPALREPPPPAHEPESVAAPEPEPVPVPPILPQDNLLARADESHRAGDSEHSIALLERAQRIAPQDPRIYAQLAAVYAAAGQVQRAAATAERGLLYCRTATECAALRRFVPPITPMPR